MFRLLALALTALVLVAHTANAAGVCYSPFYSPDYSSSGVASLLERDFKTIASQGFEAVRTYHAQFFGHNVVHAARAAGIKVAIGIQMVGTNGGEYAYLESDIQAAIAAAKFSPDSVLAIYAGNENLQHGRFGSVSGDRLVEVISRVKRALQGTAGANVPVGTVQRLEEWLNAGDAAKVAAACDVVGANIYPFFTNGGTSDMKGALNRQWAQMASRYGGKARLTETGWPSQGSSAPNGNMPSLDNAAKYYSAFADWAAQTATSSPFYFMMFDVPTATGDDFEQHFGVATSSRSMKFQANGKTQQSASNEAGEMRSDDGLGLSGAVTDLGKALGDVSAPISDLAATVAAPAEPILPTTFAPTEAPTPEPTMRPPTTPTPTTPTPTTPPPTTPPPTTEAPTPEPTTEAPTTAPVILPGVMYDGSAAAASHAGSNTDDDDIRFPGSHSSATDDDASVGDGSAGIVPSPTPTRTYVRVPTPAPASIPAATPAPAASSLSPEAQAELAIKEANSKVARDVSGGSGTTFYTAAAFVGFAGVASMVVIGVYMRRRNDVDDSETRTVAASSIDPRGSTPSVYDDPLGTRFSSIVMLTPNGDGVCIL